MFQHKIIEISVLVNTTAASLNRDINGTPKTLIFGGEERSRLSSQSIKYVIRKNKDFGALTKTAMSERTRGVPLVIWDKIKDRVEGDYEGVVKNLLMNLGTRQETKPTTSNKSTDENNPENGKNKKDLTEVPKDDDAKTSMIIAWDKEELDALAEIIVEQINKAGSVQAFAKVKIKDIVEEMQEKGIYPTALDVAFFGRMASSLAIKDVPASVHIAHAFSTHRVTQEIDFFTAVDDNKELSGAAMMGNSEYNSSCYFKYAVIDLTQMYENLRIYENWEEIMRKGVKLLIESFCEELPGGKQASYASYVMPSTIMVEIKDVKKPFNPCNAYEVSLKINPNESISKQSADTLSKYMDKMDKKYALESIRFWYDTNDVDAPSRTHMVAESTKSLYDAVVSEIIK